MRILLQEGGKEYDLYGVVEHSGSLQGGHYVAYVKYKNAKDRVGEADGVKSGYSNATRAAEKYGYWTEEPSSGDGGFSSMTKGAEQYGQAVAELGYQSDNVNKFDEDIWCYTSDSYVNVVSKEAVYNSQAYLLLYAQRN